MTEPVYSCVVGASGRLGREVVSVLRERRDNIISQDKLPVALNYLIFAHRYRGLPNFEQEMYVNLQWVIEMLERTRWAEGDRAAILVSSVCASDPAMNQSLSYNLSKAALNQAARYYAKKQSVYRINTVSPDTFTDKSLPLTARKVAETIALLCSRESSDINGQDFKVTA